MASTTQRWHKLWLHFLCVMCALKVRGITLCEHLKFASSKINFKSRAPQLFLLPLNCWIYVCNEKRKGIRILSFPISYFNVLICCSQSLFTIAFCRVPSIFTQQPIWRRRGRSRFEVYLVARPHHILCSAQYKLFIHSGSKKFCSIYMNLNHIFFKIITILITRCKH